MTGAASLYYLFVITSFVSNAIIRDDSTGFGPIIKATSIGKHHYVLGRFLGGLAVAIIGYFAIPLGMLVGTLMPWVDPETVGPQVFAYYLWPFLILAIPNIILMSSLLFGLATVTRSMLWSYVGVVALFMGYLIVTSVLGNKPEYQQALANWEPLGFGAMLESTRYWTAAEMNTKLLPFDGYMRFSCPNLLAIFDGRTGAIEAAIEKAGTTESVRKRGYAAYVGDGPSHAALWWFGNARDVLGSVAH
jgi:hypothetical protein